MSLLLDPEYTWVNTKGVKVRPKKYGSTNLVYFFFFFFFFFFCCCMNTAINIVAVVCLCLHL